MYWCSKEPSHGDSSFEYQQHMFWLRNNIVFVTHFKPNASITKDTNSAVLKCILVQILLSIQVTTLHLAAVFLRSFIYTQFI